MIFLHMETDGSLSAIRRVTHSPKGSLCVDGWTEVQPARLVNSLRHEASRVGEHGETKKNKQKKKLKAVTELTKKNVLEGRSNINLNQNHKETGKNILRCLISVCFFFVIVVRTTKLTSKSAWTLQQTLSMESRRRSEIMKVLSKLFFFSF